MSHLQLRSGLLALVVSVSVANSHTPATASDPAPPIFGPVWTAPFNQSISILGFTWVNSVEFFYDSTTEPVGSSVYIHSQGQHDEICTGVAGHEFSEEPCTLLASNDTWRYVIFPQSNECCRFCNTTQYCGIISPTWLQDNSTYVGTRTIGGMACQGWEKTGGEENYYFATIDGAQPCQYYEGYPTFDIGVNFWNFTYPEFNRNPIPSETFAVPADMGCEQQCTTTSLSYEKRLEARFARGLSGLSRVAVP